MYKPKVFFTADDHMGHANIIKYCNRPFLNVEEMDKTIIHNWNSVVSPNDIVWVIGDFTMGLNAAKYLSLLNGTKYLVLGNHDRKPSVNDGWAGIFPIHEININGKHIVLCHYAMRTWNKSHYGSYMLYGHSHGMLPDDPSLLSIDVGVDCHNFTPISFDQIVEIMETRIKKRDEI